MKDVETAPFDVVTMGRIGVDIYPSTPGSLVEVDEFRKYLGGSPTNVAVAASRLGWRSAVISRTGRDPFGEYIHTQLRKYGVDDRYVTEVASLKTPITFCELFPPDNFPIYFYREPKAPDLEIYPEEIDEEAVSNAGLLWVTLSGFSAEPSRSATLHALARRRRRHPTIIDLDYRPTFWASRELATAAAHEALPHVTVAVGNVDEVEVAVGERDPDRAADVLLALGLDLAVIKMGPAGVLAKTANDRVVSPPVPVTVVNGLGAGDAFGGSLCDGLLAGRTLSDTLHRANVAGALVASRLACSEAMPYASEIDDVLKEVHGA